jgi:hypothetical protein
MKRLYVGVESLRNSYSQILRFMPRLIAEIVLAPVADCMDAQLLRDIWTTLCVEESLATELVQLRLFFHGGRLHGTADILGLDTFADRIAYCLAALWRFTKFSESRWISVGSATKRIGCAILSGIDRVVELIQDDPTESNWHINGWSDLGLDGRTFVLTAAVSCCVSDVLLKHMLKDSRLPKTVDTVERDARGGRVEVVCCGLWRHGLGSQHAIGCRACCPCEFRIHEHADVGAGEI